MYHPHSGHRTHQPPPTQGGVMGFTPLGGERLNEMLEQVKSDYTTFESEYSLCKMQRDDFERKRKLITTFGLILIFLNIYTVEAQLSEFQSMRQQIQELDVTFQTTKQRYEEQIHQLKQKIEQLQQQVVQSQVHIS
jgi:hypothetical protein